MSRLSPLSAPFKDDVQKTLARMVPEGMEPLILFKTIAHNSRLLSRFSRGSLLDKGSIPLRTREILILRTCGLCGSEYEWGVHVGIFAGHAGFNDEQITSTASQNAAADDCWDGGERDVLALADELHKTNTISDALWARLASAWAPDQLLEMVALCGQYHMVSFICRSFDVELEDYGAKFPA